MKQSDIITVVLIAIVGTIAAFFLVNSILGDPSEKTVSFKYVINEVGDVVEPDAEVFNEDAINPTVEVYVGACVDINQDGEIDLAEKVECGNASKEETEEELKDGGSSLNVSENDDYEKLMRELRGENEED